MKRAIYTEFHSRLWLDVARTLAIRSEIEPVYWVGKRHFEPVVREYFPSVTFHARTDAIRGMPADECRNMPLRPLDASYAREFSNVLLTAGKMMDRLDAGDAFRYEERTRLFHIQLRYWRTVVERYQPDIVVFPVQPHTLYDYILYEVCQRAGVKTVMFQWTLFPDWIYPLEHIADGYGPLNDAVARVVASGEVPVLDPRAEEYWRRVNGRYEEAIPNYLLRLMPPQLREGLFNRPQAGDASLIAAATSRTPAAAHAPADADAADAIDAREERAARPLSDYWPPRRAKKILSKEARRRLHAVRTAMKDDVTRARRTVHRARKRASHSVEGVRHALRPRMLRRHARWMQEMPARARKSTRIFYKRWFRHIWHALLHGGVDRPLKQWNRTLEDSFRGRLGAIQLQIARVRGAFTKRALLEKYKSLSAEEVNLDRPYVFVALHYQPEQTTCPTGGAFMDQFLMVDMIARLVPEGWHVYVKEHPYQFFAAGVGERGRTPDLYDDLVSLPNVTLVPWTHSPFPLIDHAQAVATVTGTTGMEALLRGKPVLVFGHAWYRGCEGVFYTATTGACRDALERIASGYTVAPEMVRAFLKGVQDVCFRADMGFGEKIAPVPHEENVAHLSGAISRTLARAGGHDAAVEPTLVS